MITSTRSQDDLAVPLCVDLDGTLTRSDLLVEGFLRCIRNDARCVFLVLPWLLKGRTHLKAEIARRSSIDIAFLPVNAEFDTWLRAEHKRGRRIILSTAANEKVAEAVAEHYGIFESTISSGLETNLTGPVKADALEKLFGDQGYDYAGNAFQDIHVWRKARKSIVVEPGARLLKHLDEVPRVARIYYGPNESSARRWLRQARLHQWAKNLLIFVPAFVSHQIFIPLVAWHSCLAFLWFGLMASATYILNDLIDLNVDRRHPRKRNRPLASGEIPLTHGVASASILLSSALLGSALSLGGGFTSWLLLYLGSTLAYSLWFKRYAMIDVLWLGGLYTLRIAAGAEAIGVVPSFWLLAFSVFIFLSLALAKRYTELRSVRDYGGNTAAGRGYDIDDLPLLLSAGTSAGFVSVLVFALYLKLGADPLYRNPGVLLFACPLLLFWILRLWRAAFRGELSDDPLVFACKDLISILVALLCILLALIAD